MTEKHLLQGVMKTSVKWTFTALTRVDKRQPSTSRKPQSGRHQPIEKLSLVDVDNRKAQSGQRRPVEKLSLVDVDHENLSPFSEVCVCVCTPLDVVVVVVVVVVVAVVVAVVNIFLKMD